MLKGKDNVFYLFLANINRNILLADLPEFARVLKKGGKLVLSGFYKEDGEQLVVAARQLGLNKCLEKTRNEWACLVFDK